MKIRATVQLRNELMVKARESKDLTQADLASLSGVPLHIISRLERLQYPANYDSVRVLLIAHTLDILPEQVMPERLTGWCGRTKFSSIQDIPVERLMEYKERVDSHYILPDPSDTAEIQDEVERIKRLLECLSYREREVVKLRYGLDDGIPLTLEEVGRVFKITQEAVRRIEAKAIRELEAAASR